MPGFEKSVRRGQTGYIGAFIGILMTVIFTMGIMVPFVTNRLNDSTFTNGTTPTSRTILNQLNPLFAVAALIVVIGSIMLTTRK